MIVNKNIIGKEQYTLPYINEYKHKLDVIQNYYPVNPAVLSAITNIKINEYPYKDGEYSELLRLLGNYTKTSINNIVLTNGSDSALKLIIEAFVTKDSVVCIPNPTYPHFQSFIDNIDKKEVLNPYIVNETQLKEFDYSNVNLVYLVTPNLPLGYIISNPTIDYLLKKYPNTVFIVDEAYICYGGGESKTSLLRNNLFVVQTFSKGFGLAGLRLGYLIATQDNIKLISPLINEKNVSTVAIKAGLAVMQNLSFYEKQINDLENNKKYLSEALDEIIDSDLPVYSYSIGGGNFFMIYATDPQNVCDVFSQHKIMVRNKHSDVKNGIRICMGPINILEDVINVIRFINIKLYRKKRIGFDLDLTLRDGSTNSSPLYPGADIVNKTDSIIVTNNNTTPDVIEKYLNKHNIKPKQVITSLSSAKQYFIQNNYKIKIYGSNEIVNSYFKEIISDVFDCSFIASIDITMRDIVDICLNASIGKKIIYTDPSEICDVGSSSEFGDMYSGRFNIPDMQSIINMINKAGYATILVGKPNMIIPQCDVFVGDSNADKETANKFKIPFIHIGTKNCYNFEDNCIEISNISRM